MEKSHLTERIATLRYICNVLQGDVLWLNQIKIGPHLLSVSYDRNAANYLILGEELCAKKGLSRSLNDYLRTRLASFTQNEATNKHPKVRKALKGTILTKAFSSHTDPTPSLPFAVEWLPIFVNVCLATIEIYDEIGYMLGSKPMSYDDHTVFQKLDSKIYQQIILPGLDTLETEGGYILQQEFADLHGYKLAI